VVDTANEVILLVALRRSERPADRHRPFGYGPERFFWSFVAAVSIFVSGAIFAAVEGLRTLIGPGHESAEVLLSTVVLSLAFVLEGISWVRATKQIRQDAREHHQSVRELLGSTDDPTVKTVFYEDSAALIGVVLAMGGVWMHAATGSAMWDGLASLLIAALLALVAFRLARSH
jgi:cation diffusion facilitator family transporter